MNGHRMASHRGRHVVAVSGRDRVGVDLRGIGDAVRTAARTRQVTLASFARDAIVEALRLPVPPADPRRLLQR